MEHVIKYISTFEALLPVGNAISLREAEFRAGEFLSAMASLATFKHSMTEEKIKYLSIQTATYSEELFKGTAKTMTENKVLAEASESYQKTREDFEKLENDINLIKTYYDIFKDAHLFYRQMARGDNI